MTTQVSDRPDVKVPEALTLLYGEYAALVVLAGRLAEAARKLDLELAHLLAASEKSDSVSREAIGATGYDEKGRSDHTVWLQGMADRVLYHVSGDIRLYRTIARECQERWDGSRQPQQSQEEDFIPSHAFTGALNEEGLAGAIVEFNEQEGVPPRTIRVRPDMVDRAHLVLGTLRAQGAPGAYDGVDIVPNLLLPVRTWELSG